jgi:hypothetical protein
MTKIPYADAMIVWEPSGSCESTAGEMHVITDKDIFRDRLHLLGCSLGNCTEPWGRAKGFERAKELLLVLLAVIEDGIDPAIAHRELMKIDVYSEMIGPCVFFRFEPEEAAA